MSERFLLDDGQSAVWLVSPINLTLPTLTLYEDNFQSVGGVLTQIYLLYYNYLFPSIYSPCTTPPSPTLLSSVIRNQSSDVPSPGGAVSLQDFGAYYQDYTNQIIANYSQKVQQSFVNRILTLRGKSSPISGELLLSPLVIRTSGLGLVLRTYLTENAVVLPQQTSGSYITNNTIWGALVGRIALPVFAERGLALVGDTPLDIYIRDLNATSNRAGRLFHQTVSVRRPFPFGGSCARLTHCVWSTGGRPQPAGMVLQRVRRRYLRALRTPQRQPGSPFCFPAHFSGGTLKMGNRVWQITCGRTSEYDSRNSPFAALPFVILALGIFFSVALALLLAVAFFTIDKSKRLVEEQREAAKHSRWRSRDRLPLRVAGALTDAPQTESRRDRRRKQTRRRATSWR